MPLLLTRSASREFLDLFLLPGNRAGVTRYCSRASSTPGRLGYGDVSGREIQEKQKPAFQDFWPARPEIAVLLRDDFRQVSGNA